MKNFLIFALAAGLGTSLYFNFANKNITSPILTNQSLDLGGKLRVSFYKQDANNNNVLITSLESGQSSKDSNGTASFKNLCCPIPPRDTMAISTNPQTNCIDISGLTSVEIKPATK
jgi:hypothetical protein